MVSYVKTKKVRLWHRWPGAQAIASHLRQWGNKQSNFLKDTAMLKRLNDLNTLPDKDKEYILYALDGLIKSAKIKTL